MIEVIGRYRIDRELGRGAMGIVYHATDPTIGRSVAIKTIRLSEVDDPEERSRLRERLFREARSAGVLSHPHIVTIYDMEEQGELAYIAMEFVDGPTLDRLLSAKTALPRDRVLEILRQTAAALDYAHQRGIIHRDIKPANIMLTEGGSAKITDFGIAKVTTAAHQHTQTGAIVGTPNYMAPEQVQGLAVDGRADQFSLGVIAYEMLTGERPFMGEHLTTVVYKIVAEDPVAPQRLNPSLGPQIDSVLRKGLAKKPEARYLSCGELVSALESACAATRGWQNLPRGGSLNLPTVVAEPRLNPSVMPLETIVKTPPRGNSRALTIGAGVVVALGLIGLIALQFGAGVDFRRVLTGEAAETPANPSTQEPPPTPAPTMPAPSAEPEGKPKPEEAGGESKAGPQPRQTRPAAAARDIWVSTEPPGAAASLDNSSENACITPCMLQANPGRHTLSVLLSGFQRESREIQIGEKAVNVPLISMRPEMGTLMLSSTPSGAAVFVDGKLVSQTTPAQLRLAPGTYQISVEKDGVRKNESVQVRNGATNYLRIPLQ